MDKLADENATQKRRMARNDDPQSRVFKASDVHRRRVGKKPRSDKPSDQPERRGQSEQIEQPERAGQAGRFEPSDQLGQQVPEETPNSVSAAEPDQPAVVLTPEFGHRSERQRQSDERWFAAMREEIPEIVPTQSGEGQAERVQAEQLEADQAGQARQDETPRPRLRRAKRSEAAQPRAGQSGAEPVSESEAAPASEVASASGPGQPKPGQPAPDQPEPGQSESGQSGPDKPTLDADQPESDSKPKARPSIASITKGMSLRKRIAAIVAILLVVVIAVAVATFTWNRWYRFDDHADLQGEWYVVGTTVPVTIDDHAIYLSDDVTYEYEIDDREKTIRYTFGPMKGQGRYWFSDDRNYLVITDGDEFTSAGTAFDDLLHAFSDLPGKISGSDLKLPEGEGIIAFSREPDAEALAREKAEAEKKAAEEEAARKEAERKAAEEAAAEEAEWEEYYYYEEEEPAEEQAPSEEQPAEEQPAEEEYQEE